MSLADYRPGQGVVPGTSFDLRFMNKPKEQPQKRGKFQAAETPQSLSKIDQMIAELVAMRMTLAS